MPYTNDQKIVTAARLRQLRKSKLDKRGKPFSCKTLRDDIEKVFPTAPISDKSLSYYEIQSPENSKFYIGRGMKVENLVLLADYYGVSCDYLLGRDNTDNASVIEASEKIGLDENSTKKMLLLMRQRILNRDLLCTINNLIHSIYIDTSDYPDLTSDDWVQPELKNWYIMPEFMNYLARYLFFSCDPQYLRKYSKSKSFRQLDLSEDEVANLLLLDLQRDLQQSRYKHKTLRNAPEMKLNQLIARNKRMK